MVHPEEVLQVFELGSGPDLSEPLELSQLAAALLPLLLLQGLLRQEAAQAAVHALAHGGQGHDFASGAAASAADAAAPTYPGAAVPASRGHRATAPARLGHLGHGGQKQLFQSDRSVSECCHDSDLLLVPCC